MKPIVKKYPLQDNRQKKDDLDYWNRQSIEHKLEILESIRSDAIKLGLFPDIDADQPRLRRVFNIVEQA